MMYKQLAQRLIILLVFAMFAVVMLGQPTRAETTPDPACADRVGERPAYCNPTPDPACADRVGQRPAYCDNPAAKGGATPAATATPSTGSGSINNRGALTCAELKSAEVNAISTGGFVDTMCNLPGANPAQNAIQVLIQSMVNWLSIIAIGIFGIMVASTSLAITFGGASPESIKNAKKRLSLVLMSLGFIWGGRIFLELIGVYGTREFLNVPVDDFNTNTIYDLISAALTFIQYVAGFMSIVFIIVGGIGLMTSAGKPDGINKAIKIITYAAAGLAIAIGFPLVFSLVKQIFTGQP